MVSAGGGIREMSGRAILHVDMDAFFASVEQRENPELQGRPVIVGADPQQGKGRGVVAACSYEARRFGVHSALPISQAWRLCPQATFVRPNGKLYSHVSRAVMEILSRFTDLVEPISIDEAFLDVTGSGRLFGPPKSIAQQVKDSIRAEQRLTCSVGIAPNKFLAKIASDLEKPDGLTCVEPGSERAFLAPLPVRAIWGVGPRTEVKLRELGIETIADVARRSLEFWSQTWGHHGEHLWRLSHGIDDRPVQPASGFKSLSHESTFSQDTEDLDAIRRVLLQLCGEVAVRARKNKVAGRTVTLKWRYADFTTLTRQTSLREATDDASRIYEVVTKLVQKLLPPAQKIRLVGVGLSDFRSEPTQVGLFDPPSAKKRELNASLDRIAEKFGPGVVRKASLLTHGDDEDQRFSSFLKR